MKDGLEKRRERDRSWQEWQREGRRWSSHFAVETERTEERRRLSLVAASPAAFDSSLVGS